MGFFFLLFSFENVVKKRKRKSFAKERGAGFHPV